MRRSASEECLAQSPYFQNFSALAGVRLCSHWEPCQGDSALTVECGGASPSWAACAAESQSRLGRSQRQSVLASSEGWGKK